MEIKFWKKIVDEIVSEGKKLKKINDGIKLRKMIKTEIVIRQYFSNSHPDNTKNLKFHFFLLPFLIPDPIN